MLKTGLKPSEIRKKAIELAEIRISKHGFAKIRLIDVAKDIGISHAALYQHFSDRSSLLEAVTEKWLLLIDTELEKVSKKKGNPLDLIVNWFITLHRLKKKKVSLDPELYKAFDSAVESRKPCIVEHLKNSKIQLTFLVERAISEGMMQDVTAGKVVEICFLSTVYFHHPKLVANNLHLNQENLLKEILKLVLDGLKIEKR